MIAMMVRQAGEEDLGRIYSVMNGNLDEYFSPEVINFFMAQWPRRQFIAEDVFGNAAGAICGSRLDGGRASISLFAVDASFRRKGVGGMLLDSFRRRCFMDGFGLIQLEVRTTNADAISFYRRRGFSVSENLPHFYSDGGDAYRMSAFASGCRAS